MLISFLGGSVEGYCQSKEDMYMSLTFDVKDKKHSIIVKFVNASLPEAKKPYNLKPVHQPMLDIHGVASKADVYNITTDPKVIEDGLNDGMRLIRYLAADGYGIKTSLFRMKIRVPGEYDGNETSLPDNIKPVVRMVPSTEYREYVKEHVKIDFSGMEQTKGIITGFLDVEENLVNTGFVPGDQFVITGTGLRVEGTDPSCGVFFVPVDPTGHEVKVPMLAENTRSKIIGICPDTGHLYNKIVIRTQYSSGSALLKNIRTITSSFTLETL